MPPDRDLDPAVLAVAHRAGNSATALRAAAALGAHLAEADVHLHRGRLEVRHGRPVGRLPLLVDGWRLSSGRRPLTLRDLLVAANALGRTLDRTLGPTPSPTRSPVLMLDLKGGTRAMGERVREVLVEHAPGRRILACASRWDALASLADLDWVLLALSAGDPAQLGRAFDQLRPGPRVHAISVDHRLLTADTARRLHDQVPVVLAWTVNRPADLLRLLDLRESGTFGVISDSAAVLRRVLAESAR